MVDRPGEASPDGHAAPPPGGAPGWRQHPTEAGTVRFWDGERWTRTMRSDTSEAGTLKTVTDVLAAFMFVSWIATVAVAVRAHGRFFDDMLFDAVFASVLPWLMISAALTSATVVAALLALVARPAA